MKKKKGSEREGGEGREGEVKGFAGPMSNCCLYAPGIYSFRGSNFISVTGAEDRIIQGLP